MRSGGTRRNRARSVAALAAMLAGVAAPLMAPGLAAAVEVRQHCAGTDHPPFARSYPPGGRSYVLVAAATDLPPGSPVSGSLTGPGAGSPQEAVVDDAGNVFLALPIVSYGTYQYALADGSGTPFLTGQHVVNASEPACDPSLLAAPATTTTAAPTTTAPTTTTTAAPTTTTAAVTTTSIGGDLASSGGRDNGPWVAALVVGLLLAAGGGVLLAGGQEGTRERPRKQPGSTPPAPQPGSQPREDVKVCDWAAYYEGDDGLRTRLREARGKECCVYIVKVTTTIEDGSAAIDHQQVVWQTTHHTDERGRMVSALRRERERGVVLGRGPGLYAAGEIENRDAGELRTRVPITDRYGRPDIEEEAVPDWSASVAHHRREGHEAGYVEVDDAVRPQSVSIDRIEETRISIELVQGCPSEPSSHSYRAKGRSAMDFAVTTSCDHEHGAEAFFCGNEFEGTTPKALSMVTGALRYDVTPVPQGDPHSAKGGGFAVSTEAPSVSAELSGEAGPLTASSGSAKISYSGADEHNPPPSGARWERSDAQTVDGVSLDLTVRNQVASQLSTSFQEGWHDGDGLSMGQHLEIFHLLEVDASTNADRHARNHQQPCCPPAACLCLPALELRVGREAPDVDHHERTSRTSSPQDLADGRITVDGQVFLLTRPAMDPPPNQDAAEPTRAWDIAPAGQGL